MIASEEKGEMNAGLDAMKTRTRGTRSIRIPRIGCDYGGMCTSRLRERRRPSE
jgi:hypothetical protein